MSNPNWNKTSNQGFLNLHHTAWIGSAFAQHAALPWFQPQSCAKITGSTTSIDTSMVSNQRAPSQHAEYELPQYLKPALNDQTKGEGRKLRNNSFSS